MKLGFRRSGLRFGLLGLLVGSVMLTLLVGSSAAETASTFTFTGAEQTYSVPAGATAVTITAVGAPGAEAISGDSPGKGAVVTATVPLPDNTTTLYVEVGGAGSRDPLSCAPHAGGFNGGGSTTCYGAGGGGASDVRLDSATTALATTDTRLVVAGGGGAGSTFCHQKGGTAGLNLTG